MLWAFQLVCLKPCPKSVVSALCVTSVSYPVQVSAYDGDTQVMPSGKMAL
jgi:hypothetical protein